MAGKCVHEPTLPLSSFTVEAFRGLKNLRLEDLANINVFVGKNNCGKTSILEAFAFFCTLLEANQKFFFNNMALRKTSMLYMQKDILSWLFPQPDATNIEIMATGHFPISLLVCEMHQQDNISFELIPKKNELITMPLLQLKFNYKLNNDNNSSYKGTLLLSQSDNAPGNSINTINMSINKPTSLKKIPPCKVVKDILTRQDFSMLLQALTDIEGTDAKDEFLGLMQQYDNNIRNIYIGSSINTNTSYIYISKKNGVKTPLFAMGDGFARIVTMALLAFSAKDGMLLIDEFDSGLHFSVLKSSLSWLLKFCQKLNVQLFMSTHSLEAIDALSACTNNIENFDLALYHMHKSEIVTSITRYNQKKLNILRQEYGSEVR